MPTVLNASMALWAPEDFLGINTRVLPQTSYI